MKLTVLVIGRNHQILETVVRLVNAQPDWEASGALTDTEALEKFKSKEFQLVMIGGGVEEDSESILSNEFKKINQHVKIIRHYGGGGGLLYNEIRLAME
jgi:hypothetical protein